MQERTLVKSIIVVSFKEEGETLSRETCGDDTIFKIG